MATTTNPLAPTDEPRPPSLMDQARQIASENQVTAETSPFDESKGVEGRVNSITKSGSPLMESAATRGTQVAASRGLVHSSLGAQAAQQAVIDSALPIASTDAQLFQQKSLANMAATNAARSQNANAGVQLGGSAAAMENSNFQQGKTLEQNQRQFDVTAGQSQQQINNQSSQFGQSLAQQAELAKKEMENRTSLAQLDATTRTTLQTMDAQSRLQIANIEAAFRTDIASNQNISQAWGSMMNAIAGIQNNKDLSEATKRTLIQNNIESFQSFAAFWQKAGGGAIDVSDLLNFGVEGAGSGGGGGAGGGPVSDTGWPAGVGRDNVGQSGFVGSIMDRLRGGSNPPVIGPTTPPVPPREAPPPEPVMNQPPPTSTATIPRTPINPYFNR